MELNKEQLKVEAFFYDEIIRTNFEKGQIKIKELGNQYSLKKVDTNGNFDILNGSKVIANFTNRGLEFV